MAADQFIYPLDADMYAAEGFDFRLKGINAELVVTPARIAGIANVALANAWITLEASFWGFTYYGCRYRGEVPGWDGLLSVFFHLLADIDNLLSETSTNLVFPSPRSVECIGWPLSCRVERCDRAKQEWTALCRCAAPGWWNQNQTPPSDDDGVAAALSLVMTVDVDSLRSWRQEIDSFVGYISKYQP